MYNIEICHTIFNNKTRLLMCYKSQIKSRCSYNETL